MKLKCFCLTNSKFSATPNLGTGQNCTRLINCTKTKLHEEKKIAQRVIFSITLKNTIRNKTKKKSSRVKVRLGEIVIVKIITIK